MPEEIVRACHVDQRPGRQPEECVLDSGMPELCLYASEIRRREECHWWRESQDPSIPPTRPDPARPAIGRKPRQKG